jgi:hypothetical protein
MQKQCLDCGEPLKGRSDKKFCADQCRNNYHNYLNRTPGELVRSINSVLRRNRRILSELNPAEKVTVHRNKLLEKGFDFTFYTHTRVTRKGHVYRFCYEQGYLQLENNFYALVMRKNEGY